MNNNKNTKRKFNSIDILVIIIVIGLISGGYYKFMYINNNNSTAKSETQNMQYEIKISGVRQPTVDAIEINANIYDNKTGAYLGKIINKEVENAKGNILLDNGNFIQKDMPGKYNIYLVIETSVIEKEDGYYAGGKMEIKQKSELIIKSKKFEVISVVSDIF